MLHQLPQLQSYEPPSRPYESAFLKKMLKQYRQDDPNHCKYFVQRKKRYCRMTVKEGNEYCGEHQQNQAEIKLDAPHKRRIACPLDPNHTCFETKLEKHLMVCNVQKKEDDIPDFIVKGINLGDIFVKQPTHTPLSLIDQSIVDAVINKINSAYEHLPPISERILSHEILEEEINKPIYGHSAKRHLLQNSSLLGHLRAAELSEDKTCYIEFGAGKGKLAYWLAHASRGQKESSLLLVDRSSHRHKMDNKLKDEPCSLKVTRIRADIADLQLSKVTEIGKRDSIVGVAKHLCGTATDLTLRCLMSAKKEGYSVEGLIIAFCCHHRCEFSSYVGKQYLKSCGFSTDEFPILCSIASWATCGFEKNLKANNEDKQEETQNDQRTYQEREEMGRKVKMLLNWGRLQFLRHYDFKCELIQYTSAEISLENVCIVAKKDKEYYKTKFR